MIRSSCFHPHFYQGRFASNVSQRCNPARRFATFKPPTEEGRLRRLFSLRWSPDRYVFTLDQSADASRRMLRNTIVKKKIIDDKIAMYRGRRGPSFNFQNAVVRLQLSRFVETVFDLEHAGDESRKSKSRLVLGVHDAAFHNSHNMYFIFFFWRKLYKLFRIAGLYRSRCSDEFVV